MNLWINTSLQGLKCQVQVAADSLSFQDPAPGRSALRNNGIKVICVSAALLS